MELSSSNMSKSSQQQEEHHHHDHDHDHEMMMKEMIRKRKRTMSNRESARRSRHRKQRHVEDLTARVSQMRSNNGQITATIDATKQKYMSVEAENSILRAQLGELCDRLHSLNEIICFWLPLESEEIRFGCCAGLGFGHDGFSMNSMGLLTQDMFMC